MDIAEGSLKDAVDRITQGGARNKFKIRLAKVNLGTEKMEEYKTEVWDSGSRQWAKATALTEEHPPFHLASIQFALHYMFEEPARAELFFDDVSSWLEEGGRFLATTVDARTVVQLLMAKGKRRGDEWTVSIEDEPLPSAAPASPDNLCTISLHDAVYQRLVRSDSTPGPADDAALYGLRYEFQLNDTVHETAVNAPEWLVPLPLVEALGRRNGLRLEKAENFHDFCADLPAEDVRRALNCRGTLSNPEWAISRLYMVLQFRKDSSLFEEAETEHAAPPPTSTAAAVEEDDGANLMRFLAKRSELANALGPQLWAALGKEEQTRRVHAALAP